MIKQYFTDGLIQIAIILSLLRTDLNNWHLHNNNFINYPEVQDIILGQSIAYAPTSFHNNYNTINGLSGSSHPKHIENDFNSAIFRDLRSLSRFRRFEGIDTDVNAFLVGDTFSNPSESSIQSQPDSVNNEAVNNDNAQSAIPTESSVSISATQSESDSNEEVLGAVGFSEHPVLSAEDPTNEDLDLIEVLWRQDIDLGIGKEVFDPNLRRELEHDREVELQKTREKQKELELLKQKAEDESRQQQQEWLSQNFMQDGETGEWVPLNATVSSPPPQLLTPELTNTELLNSTSFLEEALDILNSEATDHLVTPPPDTQPSPTDLGVENFLFEAEPLPSTCNGQPLQVPLASFGRQDSLDRQWDDLVSLLDLAGLNSTGVNAAQLNYTDLEHSQVNLSEAVDDTVAPTVNSSVLLQNATIPLAINNTAPEYSSVPSTEGLSSLDWEASEMLFNNVAINNTESINGIITQFLPEDELDMALNEGLETMQMLDEVSSDSAISMGSGSPLQDLTDSGSMSPYDGLEGATGGSDFDSPPYSKLGKYDNDDDYHYASCSYSQSPQTNCSTSSNDTDVSRPLGGSNHLNHNHTYPLKPGASPRQFKTGIKSEDKMKGPHARDAKRARELAIPFSMDEIIESPVEEFNDLVSKKKLNEPQIQMIRDIRRRGKNKVAAQNCRKRKLDVVVTLEDEMTNLQNMKEKLLRERQQIDKQTRDMKERFSRMYQEIFRSLRDENGHPYDSNEFSLQQSSDGNVFLVPRSVSTAADDQHINKRRKNKKE